MELSGYRFMWILAMFDLPTETKKARHDYALFRKHLLEDGFMRIQYSVYVRHCPSRENAAVHIGRIKSHLPPDGEVRVLSVTDKQFERMLTFWGKIRKKPDEAPRQLELF